MATYRFRVMSSGQPYYETDGNGINWGVARTNVARREGVDESEVCYLGEVESQGYSNESSFDGGDVGGYVILGAILFGIWLLMKYWWIIIPGAAIVGFLIWYNSKN